MITSSSRYALSFLATLLSTSIALADCIESSAGGTQVVRSISGPGNFRIEGSAAIRDLGSDAWLQVVIEVDGSECIRSQHKRDPGGTSTSIAVICDTRLKGGNHRIKAIQIRNNSNPISTKLCIYRQ